MNVDFTLGVEGVTETRHGRRRRPAAADDDRRDQRHHRQPPGGPVPANGRNFLALAQLSNAVVLPPGGTRGDALQQAGPLPNVGGQRSGHNIYLLDGAKVTDELFNNLVINPSVDSIQEFKIQKSMYPAEFGGKASALINVATKAGGNVMHGSLFEFHRNDIFDAHNYFDSQDAPVPPLRQNQFGGALGGPLMKDRSFFFVSYEGPRMHRSLTRTFSVPSDAFAGGNFAGLRTDLRSADRSPPTGELHAVCEQSDSRGPHRSDRRRISPARAACHLGRAVPEPDSVGGVDAGHRPVQRPVDHRLTSADQVFVRFSTFDADELQPFGTSALQEALVPGFGRTLGTKTRNLVVSHTHIFGSSLLNELRFGWMKVDGGQASLNARRGLRRARWACRA